MDKLSEYEKIVTLLFLKVIPQRPDRPDAVD